MLLVLVLVPVLLVPVLVPVLLVLVVVLLLTLPLVHVRIAQDLELGVLQAVVLLVVVVVALLGQFQILAPSNSVTQRIPPGFEMHFLL